MPLLYLPIIYCAGICMTLTTLYLSSVNLTNIPKQLRVCWDLDYSFYCPRFTLHPSPSAFCPGGWHHWAPSPLMSLGLMIGKPSKRPSEGERNVRSCYLFPWCPSSEVARAQLSFLPLIPVGLGMVTALLFSGYLLHSLCYPRPQPSSDDPTFKRVFYQNPDWGTHKQGVWKGE